MIGTKDIVMVVVGIVILSVLFPFFVIQDDEDAVDVMIIAGQSNAAYSNVAGSVDLTIVDQTLGNPSENLYYYGNATRPTMHGDVDTNYSWHPIYVNGQYAVGGLVAPTAYYLSEKNNRDAAIISIGYSAQSIANLIPGSEGGDWSIAIIDAALDSLKEQYEHVNMVGWMWLQGESDISMPVDTYKSDFLQLENYFKSIGCPNCYIVETRYQYGGNATVAQHQLIQQYKAIHLGTDVTNTFTGTDYMLDNLHYSQAARIIISEDVVDTTPRTTNNISDEVQTILYVIPILALIGAILAIVYTYKSNHRRFIVNTINKV